MKILAAAQSPFYTAALDYRNRSWPSMPVWRQQTKKPAVRWKELQTRLPSDEELLHWFGNRRDRNIGIITGAFAGFFALDVDGETGWRTIGGQLDAAGESRLPPTVETESRPGRRQFWFKHPGWHIANAQGFLPGLDLRGDGGYVQAPPSIHGSAGTTYVWIHHPDETEMADAPQWLLDYARKPARELGGNSEPLDLSRLNGHAPEERDKAYAWAALVGECEKVAQVGEGLKHKQLLNSAIAIAGFIPCGAIDAQTIEDNLFAAIENRAADKQNALETIRDGIKYGTARPREIPPDRDANGLRLRKVTISGTARMREPGDDEYLDDEEEGDPGDDDGGPSNDPSGGTDGSDSKSSKEESSTESSRTTTELTLGYPLTDTGNAERFVSQWGDATRFCPPWSTWLIWNGAVWERDAIGAIHQMGKQTVRRIYVEAQEEKSDEKRTALGKHAVNSEARKRRFDMIDLASKESEIAILPDKFDRDSWLLNCANGTLDLHTGLLRAHRKADFLTLLSPVAFDSAADCPLFKAFLLKIMAERQALVDFLQLAIGYALTGSTREQCFFILHGGGNNGKSTLLNILQMLFGTYCVHAKEEVLLAQRYQNSNNDEVAMLRCARLVSAVETDEGKRFAEARVKQLTGGDPITVCRKYEHPFTFLPEFKIFMATNHKPEIRGNDEGIWRKIRLVPFDVKFWRADKGESGPDHLKADLMLPAALEKELPGILKWAVEGCRKWDTEGMMVPKEVQAATQQYRDEQDVLAGFLDDRCISAPHAQATAAELYLAYKEWSQGNAQRAIGQIMFGKRLAEKGYTPGRGRHGEKMWIGVGILTNISSNAGEPIPA